MPEYFDFSPTFISIKISLAATLLTVVGGILLG